MRHFFRDDASAFKGMKVHVTEKLGPKQSITSDGSLLCEEVPIARTGMLHYGPDETPIPPGADGIVRVLRSEQEVFRPEFVLSFAGKAVVNEHPEQDVNPDNWTQLARGVVLNPRRGTGLTDGIGNSLDQFIVADLLISDRATIADVQAGKREVSAGYEAEYEETAIGVGRQYNMLGNHVALVTAGRCGSRCAIGDKDSLKKQPEKIEMKTRDDTTRMSVRDRIAVLSARFTEAFKAKDQKAMDEATADLDTLSRTIDEGGEALHLHLGGGQGGNERKMSDDDIEQRFAGLEQGMSGITDALGAITEKLTPKDPDAATDAEPSAEEKVEREDMKDEAPEEKKEEAVAAKDSAFFTDSFQETVALAEVLAPGIRVPTFDAASAPKKTFDAICALRRTALEIAYSTNDGRAAIHQVNGNRPLVLAGMKCRDVRTVFRAAGGLRKAQNNAVVAAPAVTADRSTERLPVGPVNSLAEYNARMRAKYAPKPA